MPRIVPPGGGAAAATVYGQYKRTRLKHSSNLTTTSTSYVDIDATLLPALSLTLAVNDEVELLLYIGSLNITTAGNVISFDWLIDRPTSADTTVRALESCDAAGVFIGVGFDTAKFAHEVKYQFICTEAGAHTFKPQWKVGGATATIVFSDANYDAPVLHRVTNLGPVAA